MERFSVSLVYSKIEGENRTDLLKVLITDAIDEFQALGKAMEYFSEETENFQLCLKAIANIKPPDQTSTGGELI